jgi:hypothetical protein
VALLAGCSSGDDAAAPGTTAPRTTEVDVPPTTTGVRPIRDVPSVRAPLPRAGEALADGEHAVRITEAHEWSVTVDVVQWLDGQAGKDAFEADTGDPDGPPNDYYIRNTSQELRTLPVAPDADVTFAYDEHGIGELPGTVSQIGPHGATYAETVYWITVRSGTVIGIHEQYRP